jgi:CTP:molybdopterin cytidylyltransferase MocA
LSGPVAAVVLAAGASSRFGSPKQDLLLPLVLERLRSCPVDEIVVVEGAFPLGIGREDGITVVPCADWALGPGASLRCGLAALGSEVEGAVVVLGDGPRLDPEAVERVLTSRGQGETLLAASYGGVRGHPVYLARDGWNDVPDGGLRELEAGLVACDDLEPPGDVDTLADWPG